jgi:signal transduction histidine kinase/CheY-like chemotaxis protein
VGGDPKAAALEGLQPLWPMLGQLLACEQRSRASAGELRTARSEMRQYAAQAEVLDETRLKLDETVRKVGEQARRAEEAGRAKDEFLAMLGLELRNPLSPIVSTLEVLRLRDAWLPELDVVQRQVRHLERLMEDLLDISRIARGKLSLDPVPLDLVDVLALARESAPELARKRQSVYWGVPEAGLTVSGDRARLVQVFSNLLDNAAKYSDEHTCIRVEAHVEGTNVHVSIRDQGIGLAPDQLEQVFEMFEQGGRIGEFAGGLGLGLAIVRNLVSHHGGRVWAESEGRGHGSSFNVELPLVDAVCARDDATATHEEEADAGIALRVLAVDDNIDALTTLGWVLRIYGCEVLEVASANEALARAPAFAPHVAILDIGMPEMDGMTLARRLRDAMGQTTPRLVALTGYGQGTDRQRAIQAGFDEFLVKPVEPAALQQMIREMRADL